MTQYHQKKIAMINDLSGYGRCSITAALPVLAALKIQCCPVPTSVLSNHTGFPVYFLMIILIKWNLILKNGKNWDYPLMALSPVFRL